MKYRIGIFIILVLIVAVTILSIWLSDCLIFSNYKFIYYLASAVIILIALFALWHFEQKEKELGKNKFEHIIRTTDAVKYKKENAISSKNSDIKIEFHIDGLKVIEYKRRREKSYNTLNPIDSIKIKMDGDKLIFNAISTKE